MPRGIALVQKHWNHKMTRRQKAHLDFIVGWWKLYGYAPAYRDITEGLGISAVSNTHRIVKALEERGYLKIIPNRARAIYPTEKALLSNDVPEFIQSPNEKK